MKKDLSIIFGLFLLIVVLLFFGGGITTVGFLPRTPPQQTARSSDETEVRVKTLNVSAKIADSADERKKGLSKMDSLPLDEGLLFVFEEEGIQTFWMKDMKFPIDIVWIDANRRISHIVENALPEPRRDDKDLTRYRPPIPSLYVLEVNAGLSRLHGLQAGDLVGFEL